MSNILVNLGLERDTSNDVPMKYCPRCQKSKPVTEYHKHSGQADGLQSRCIECRKREDNNASLLIRNRMRIPKAPLGTACELCGRTDFILQFDHCHKTEKFRGWLCKGCNSGIGQLGDDIAGLERAINYLKKTETIT